MMLKNTNCYLVKGYENGVHCQRAPFVHFSSTKTRLDSLFNPGVVGRTIGIKIYKQHLKDITFQSV